MYKFIIHHDLQIKGKPALDKTGKETDEREVSKEGLSRIGFPGHAYVEIQNTSGESLKVVGFHVDKDEPYKDDSGRLKDAQQYQKEHPEDKVLFSKEFDIT